jgi:hypothetical protein
VAEEVHAMETLAEQLEAARRARSNAEAAERFWEAHYQELLKLYPEQFVAVHDDAVIAVSAALDDLTQKLDLKGVDPSDLWVRFITREPGKLLR